MENTKNHNKRSKKWLVLLLLLLLLLLLGLFFWKFNSKTPSTVSSNTVSDSQITTDQQVPATKIIKCQNTVVTPKVTTELFTYADGNKIRADYRIGAISEKDSFITQILFDGEWVYFWNPPLVFDNNEKPNNTPGLKMKTSLFDYKTDLSKLDIIEPFKEGSVSGDRLCKEWDDVDPVFEIPADVEFKESSDTQKKIAQDLDKICQPCEQISDSSVKSVCRKNLGC